jgi:hypothetical protein
MTRTRLHTKLLAAAIPVGIAILSTTAPAVGKGLGNGPSGPPRTPGRVDLAPSRPLIDLQFKNGRVTGLTGTAVPKNMQKRPTGVAPRTQAKCSVNFTHSTRPDSGNTLANWFGGIGCARSMLLVGQATLNQSAKTISGTGRQYLGVMKSGSSGRNNTIVKAPHPSLYIVHITNVLFSAKTSTGRITVYPAAGQQVNAATRCISQSSPSHGPYVHCELYTDRF